MTKKHIHVTNAIGNLCYPSNALAENKLDFRSKKASCNIRTAIEQKMQRWCLETFTKSFFRSI